MALSETRVSGYEGFIPDHKVFFSLDKATYILHPNYTFDLISAVNFYTLNL